MAMTFLAAAFVCSLIGYGMTCLYVVLTDQGWTPATVYLLIFVAVLVFVVLCLWVNKFARRKYIQTLTANGPVVAYIGAIIAYRIHPSGENHPLFSLTQPGSTEWTDEAMMVTGICTAVLYPFVVWFKYCALPSFNQWRLRREFYPPSKAFTRRAGQSLDESVSAAADAIHESGQKGQCWPRWRRQPGFLAMCGLTCERCCCGRHPRVVDPKVTELDTTAAANKSKCLPKYTAMITLHDWQRHNAPRVEGEENYTAGFIRHSGIRRVDCGSNVYWNPKFKTVLQKARAAKPAFERFLDVAKPQPRVSAADGAAVLDLPTLPTVNPLDASCMTLSRAMAISAAAVADAVGDQGGDSFDRKSSTLVLSGITMGFWFTIRDGVEVVGGFATFALAMLPLILTPLIGDASAPITVVTWMLWYAFVGLWAVARSGVLPEFLARFSLVRQALLILRIQTYTKGKSHPEQLYVSDGGHVSNLSVNSQLIPDKFLDTDPAAATLDDMPTGLRVLQWDGGEYPELATSSSGLDRAAQLAARYFGCRVAPIFAGTFPPDKRGPFIVDADDSIEASIDKLVAYKTALFRLTDAKDPEHDRPCCLLFEVLYPGQSPTPGGDLENVTGASNLVLYMVPRERGMLNMAASEPQTLPHFSAERWSKADLDARDQHFKTCHRHEYTPPVAAHASTHDMDAALDKARPHTYGCVCRCCNSPCCKILGGFPNNTTANQFYTPDQADAYHRAGFNAMHEAVAQYPAFFPEPVTAAGAPCAARGDPGDGGP